jgi:hypothetical protein
MNYSSATAIFSRTMLVNSSIALMLDWTFGFDYETHQFKWLVTMYPEVKMNNTHQGGWRATRAVERYRYLGILGDMLPSD